MIYAPFILLALVLAVGACVLAALLFTSIFSVVVRAVSDHGAPTATTRVAERLALLSRAHPVERDVAALIAALGACPPGWRALREAAGECAFAAWTDAEFDAFVAHHAAARGPAVTRVAPPYARYCFELAALACARGDWPTAVSCARRGLVLEPDQPLLWCAQGVALEGLGRRIEALACYDAAATQRPWSEAQTALGLAAAAGLRAEIASG